MKALVKAKDEVGLVLSEVDVPKIGNEDVLIKVKTTAICGQTYISGTGINGQVAQLKPQ